MVDDSETSLGRSDAQSFLLGEKVMIKTLAIVVCFVLFNSVHTIAAPVFEYTSQDRHVSAYDPTFGPAVEYHATDFGHFSARALAGDAIAAQDSTLGGVSMDITGGSGASNVVKPQLSAESVTHVEFNLSDFTTVDFLVLLEGGDSHSLATTSFQLTLSGFQTIDENFPDREVVLYPGPHVLDLRAQSNAGGGASYRFQMSVIRVGFVPLPRGVWAGLGTMAILGMFAARKRLMVKSIRRTALR
jgi:hypothetical protein